MRNKKLYIVRHGQTDFNLRGIIQGSGVDSSLNATGRAQAGYFYAKYGDMPFEVVLTSALQRTHQSIAPFIEAGIPWEQHPEINEMGWGDHEGKAGTSKSIAEYERIKNGWSKGRLDGRIANGESAREMGDRLQRFIDHLRDRPEGLILVCSHGRAMAGLLTLLMGRPLTRMNELKNSNLGLWIGYEQTDGSYDFTVQNDQSHFPEPNRLGQW